MVGIGGRPRIQCDVFAVRYAGNESQHEGWVMAEFEWRVIWQLKLVYWMWRYRYQRNPIKAWLWSCEDCWIETYYDNGYTAHAAIREDMSYG